MMRKKAQNDEQANSGLGKSIKARHFFVLALYQPYLDAGRRFPMEWIILSFLGVLGVLFWVVARKHRNKVTEEERRRLMLGSAYASFDHPQDAQHKKGSI